MPDRLPQEPPADAATPKAEDATRDHGKAPATSHLTRRQKRNTELTEEAQANPTGGAHSDTPDRSNP